MTQALNKYISSLLEIEFAAVQLKGQHQDQDREAEFSKWARTILPLFSLAALVIGVLVGLAL